MATTTAQASDPRVQQAMETLTAQWYNAVITGCGLDRDTFQLFQGNGTIGSTSENMWNIFDVVPPLSVSHYYNPSQANVFSSDYGSVVNNLIPQNSTEFQNSMGDYYAKWTAYLDTNPPMPAGGILQLFKNWAQLHLSPGLAQKCYTEYQQVAGGVVPVAVQMWSDAGGATSQKAYNHTIVELQDQLATVRGRSFSMNSATESSDVTDSWAKGSVGGWYDIFAGEAGGSWEKFTSSVTKSGVVVTATFDHLLTFAAAGLAKASTDPILSGYQPWYYEPALSLGYHHDDNLVWQHGAPSWADTFGPKGNLLRTASALVVIDGVKISVRSQASFDSVEQQQIKAHAKVGFFPFFEADASGGWSNDVEFDDAGRMTMSSQSPTGNPQTLGAIVTPIGGTLGGGQDDVL
jgi:hypothetical protein